MNKLPVAHLSYLKLSCLWRLLSFDVWHRVDFMWFSKSRVTLLLLSLLNSVTPQMTKLTVVNQFAALYQQNTQYCSLHVYCYITLKIPACFNSPRLMITETGRSTVQNEFIHVYTLFTLQRNVYIVTACLFYTIWTVYIGKYEIGGACSKHEGKTRCIQGFGGENWGKETTWKV